MEKAVPYSGNTVTEDADLIVLLMILDMINPLAAFRFEHRFDLRMILLVPFLRFGHRQLLCISLWRAMGDALLAELPGWRKLLRTGGVGRAGR